MAIFEDDVVPEEIIEQTAVEVEASVEDDEEILPTDIVFDCPKCGHSLVIDYRGAGLETRCVECGESVLVPIPDGMKVDDLDLNPGELLVQLFQTRRMLGKSEARVRELEEALESVKSRRTELEKAKRDSLHKNAELVGLCQTSTKLSNDLGALLQKISAALTAE